MSASSTVVGLMNQIERAPGQRIMVVSGAESLSLDVLRDQSSRMANSLIGLGLSPGSRVAYVGMNHLDYFVLEFALLKAGLVKVPLNHRLTAHELVASLQLADVRAIVTDEPTAEVLDEVRDSLDDVLLLVMGARDGWASLRSLVAQGSATSPRVNVDPDDIYHIRFSSGSTGKAKGIAISHRGARAAMLGNTWAMSVSAPIAAPRTLQVAPLVYAGGWSVFPTWLRGGTSIVLPRFDADETLRVIKDEAIDWMFAVPTMLRRISQSTSLSLLHEARLSCLMLAGEPAAISALEVVTQHTNALAQSWGQTEAPASTTLLTREEMARPELWSSIGRPIPGVEFSLLIDDVVVDVPETGAVGELVIRSQTIASALLGADEEYARRLLRDGWWRTSDLARFDEEGRIEIVGRASETIITGGTNIQPVEIERALEQCPGVCEAVVVGVPDANWGETPAALVYIPEFRPSDASEIWGSLRGRLAGFKLPKHLFVSTEPIPRQSGEAKVARGDMKRTLASWVVDPSSTPTHTTRVEESRA